MHAWMGRDGTEEEEELLDNVFPEVEAELPCLPACLRSTPLLQLCLAIADWRCAGCVNAGLGFYSGEGRRGEIVWRGEVAVVLRFIPAAGKEAAPLHFTAFPCLSVVCTRARCGFLLSVFGLVGVFCTCHTRTRTTCTSLSTDTRLAPDTRHVAVVHVCSQPGRPRLKSSVLRMLCTPFWIYPERVSGSHCRCGAVAPHSLPYHRLYSDGVWTRTEVNELPRVSFTKKMWSELTPPQAKPRRLWSARLALDFCVDGPRRRGLTATISRRRQRRARDCSRSAQAPYPPQLPQIFSCVCLHVDEFFSSLAKTYMWISGWMDGKLDNAWEGQIQNWVFLNLFYWLALLEGTVASRGADPGLSHQLTQVVRLPRQNLPRIPLSK